MNLVDSSGWLEYFAHTGRAGFFQAAIEDMARLVVPTICLYEVHKKILQQRSRAEALAAVASMKRGLVLDFDASLAIEAADFSAARKIPMADSIIYVTGLRQAAKIFTQDEHLAGLPGVEYFPKKI